MEPASDMTSPSFRWYVAQTRPHSENKASVHLRRQGFEVYLPRYLKQRRHARRVDTIAKPLFPNYLFVAVDLSTQRWLSIQSTIGVSRLVRDGDRPAPVPQQIIDTLRSHEDDHGLIRLQRAPRFMPGDKVRVVGGAFSDCLGLYEGMSGEDRVKILLELLGRKVRVVVDSGVIDAA
jgi:transcriptional antiterminator RfaH